MPSPDTAPADAGRVPSGSGRVRPHESAVGHVTGSAPFTDDIPDLPGTLHGAPVLSPVPHARLLGIRAEEALACPGVVAVLTAGDLPGDPILHALAHDEPVLARETVEYAGQVAALVLAADVRTARRAARLVRLDLDPLPPVIALEDAVAAADYVCAPARVLRGDPDAAIAAAPFRLVRELRTGAQEHYYLEGQVAYAVPGEQGEMLVASATQSPHDVQVEVAAALGIPAHRVRVTCRRLGGGFGGKESQAGAVAVLAALGAWRTGCPVRLRLSRRDDIAITGKRHEFWHRLEVGYDETGRILGLRDVMASRCGAWADLSDAVNDRAVMHLDNAYYLPDVSIESLRCRTNTNSATAFRGFGGPQGIIAIETVMGDIARALDLDPLAVRLANAYAPAGSTNGRDTTPYGMRVVDCIVQDIVADLAADCDYARRREQVQEWNAGDPLVRRGLALTPVKFGISFTATGLNQAGALVVVYDDGSVGVHHGGTEMGQGLHTKILRIVADTLGVPVDAVRVFPTDTAVVPNTSPTAASSGADMNGQAARRAATTVRGRIVAHVAQRVRCSEQDVTIADGIVRTPSGSADFATVVAGARMARVQLWSDGYYATPGVHFDRAAFRGQPYFYFAYGAACSEVEVDTSTGECRLRAVDIVHDAGDSLHPAIDEGQVEGAFVQGLGWLVSEELVRAPDGTLLTLGASTYKIPTAADVPERFRVRLWQRPNAADTIGRSKAVGEPPLMLAISVFEAIRAAVASVRPDDRSAVLLDPPATPERVLAAIRTRTGR